MKRFSFAFIFLFLLGLALPLYAPLVSADTIGDLKSKIDERNAQIKKLEEDIAQYEGQIQQTSSQAKTLQNTLQALELSRQKLLADLAVTQGKISATSLAVEKLSLEIGDKQQKIEENTEAIAESMRKMNELESNSLLESMLSYPTLAGYWNEVDTLARFQKGIEVSIADLKGLKADLTNKKNEQEVQKTGLIHLQNELGDRKKIVEENKNEKATLLSETKNKESLYKKTLAEKKALKDAFEKELFQFESQLKLEIDLSKIPSPNRGMLSWPLDSIRITQEFGDTEFSRIHTAVYSGKGHNGVDFAAAVGTAVKAAEKGIVKGFGDTDVTCPGASYGRWILVEHPNGLSTLYAHLSVISVASGDIVSRGQIIGYSGNTGYTTGPHLHFTVYSTQGVQIIERPSVACGTTYRLPVADFRAYLNPLLYL